MEVEKPGYYAVIPANVRYSKEVSNGAKLLYAEITCLSNMHGYCWAGNKYFADLYGSSNDTISRWISELARAGFILTIVDSSAGNSRKIWLSETQGIGKKTDRVSAKKPIGYRQKTVDPIGKNADIIVKENNKNETTTKEKIDVGVFDPEVNALIVESLEFKAEEVERGVYAPPAAARRFDPFDIEQATDEMISDYRCFEMFKTESGWSGATLTAFADTAREFTKKQNATENTYPNRTEFRKHFFNFVRRKAEIARNIHRPGASTQSPVPTNIRRL